MKIYCHLLGSKIWPKEITKDFQIPKIKTALSKIWKKSEKVRSMRIAEAIEYKDIWRVFLNKWLELLFPKTKHASRKKTYKNINEDKVA